MGGSGRTEPEVVGRRSSRQLDGVAAHRLVGRLAIDGEWTARRRSVADLVVACMIGVGDRRPTQGDGKAVAAACHHQVRRRHGLRLIPGPPGEDVRIVAGQRVVVDGTPTNDAGNFGRKVPRQHIAAQVHSRWLLDLAQLHRNFSGQMVRRQVEIAGKGSRRAASGRWLGVRRTGLQAIFSTSQHPRDSRG